MEPWKRWLGILSISWLAITGIADYACVLTVRTRRHADRRVGVGVFIVALLAASLGVWIGTRGN